MTRPTQRRVPSLANIYPGQHTLKIEEFFEAGRTSAAVHFPPLSGVEQLRHAYFLCFTNRSGSNFVAEAIASSRRCAQAGEWLNHEQVTRVAKRHKHRSYSEYLSWLIRINTGDSGIFGCKVNPDQIVHLFNIGALDQLQGRLTFIHVVRDDIVRQAVSMFRASATKQWTSRQMPTQPDPGYDSDVLARIMFGVERSNAAFRAFFRLVQAEPITIRYEEFVEAPGQFVTQIGERIGLPGLEFRQEGTVLQRQASASNDLLRQQLLADFALGAQTQRTVFETRHAAPRAPRGRPLQQWLNWLRLQRLPSEDAARDEPPTQLR